MILYEHAPLRLSFLVVGGGIGGLSAAYVLCKAGHRVRVLERSTSLSVPAGGLRVPPNLSKILKEWIGTEEMSNVAVRCSSTPWWDLHSGDRVGTLLWKQEVMTETGGDFVTMHHEDVHRLLYRLAMSAGVQIELGATVASVAPGTPTPSVTLTDGRVIEADVIIGADGPASIVRKAVLDQDDDAEPAGFTVFGATISGAELKKDPQLEKWLHGHEWSIFMGTNRSICAHAVQQKAESDYILQLYWPDEDAGTGPDAKEGWQEVVPTDSLKYDECSEIVQRLMKLVPFLVRTRWMNRPYGVPEWSDESGRIVLIGEAAHPWFPGGSHGASMAVEDAVVFGSLFVHIADYDQIPSFMSAYQEIREDRCAFVKQADITNAQMVRMPPGPMRDQRNQDMARDTGDWDEGVLAKEFEEFAEIFGYVAKDAAEEWWVNWGRFSQAARESVSQFPLDFNAGTSVTTNGGNNAS